MTEWEEKGVAGIENMFVVRAVLGGSRVQFTMMKARLIHGSARAEICS